MLEEAQEEAQYESEMREAGARQVLIDREKEDLVDVGAILRTLYLGRKTLVVFMGGACALAIAAVFVIPPMYTSTASFLPPNSGGSSATSALAGQLSQLSGLSGGALGGGKGSGDLYLGILNSRSVRGELSKRFDLKSLYKVKKESQAEKVLASHSTFEIDAKSTIVTISVTDKSAARAHDLANAYLDALTEKNGQLALTESSQRRLFFGQQLAKEKDDLKNAEVALKETEENSGLIAPASQTASEIQMIAQARARISEKQVELAALRLSATEENPELIRLESEIQGLQDQLSRLQTGTDKRLSGAIPTSKVPEMALDYVRKAREVKYHETLFEMLSRQYEQARIDEARNAPLVQVLDSASYPDSKSSPRPVLMVLGGLILGCLLGGTWILLRDRVQHIRASLASPADHS
jgi:tyrosine-protein kinase Etk/Wzc